MYYSELQNFRWQLTNSLNMILDKFKVWLLWIFSDSFKKSKNWPTSLQPKSYLYFKTIPNFDYHKHAREYGSVSNAKQVHPFQDRFLTKDKIKPHPKVRERKVLNDVSLTLFFLFSPVGDIFILTEIGGDKSRVNIFRYDVGIWCA